MNFFYYLLILGLLGSCASGKKIPMNGLKLGMTKDEVKSELGFFVSPKKMTFSPWEDGRKLFHYNENEYLWYTNEGLLKGFTMTKIPNHPNGMVGYVILDKVDSFVINEPKGSEKVFIGFQPLSDIRWREAQTVFNKNYKIIQKMIKSKGYKVVSSPKNADAIIVVKLGISDPKNIKVVKSLPIYDVKSSGPITVNNVGYSEFFGYSNSSTFINKSDYERTYRGERVIEENKTEYIRSLEMICFRNDRHSSKKKVLWSHFITSQGYNPNLKTIFPYLLYGSSKVLGKSVNYTSIIVPVYNTEIREIIGLNNPQK